MTVQLGTRENLALFVGGGLAELDGRLTASEIVGYFAELGTDFPVSLVSNSTFTSALTAPAEVAATLRDRVQQLKDAAADDDVGQVNDLADAVLGGILDLLTAIPAIGAALIDVAGSLGPLTPADVTAFANSLPARAVDDAVSRSLESLHHDLAAWLGLFGLYEQHVKLGTAEQDEDAGIPYPRHAQRTLFFDRLPGILANPLSNIESTFGWGTSTLDVDGLMGRVSLFVKLLGFAQSLRRGADDLLEIHAPTLTIVANQTTVPPGLDLTFGFDVPDDVDLELELRPGLAVHTTTQGEFERGFTLTLIPPGRLEFTPPATPFTGGFQSTFTQTPVAPATSLVLLGQAGGSRVEAASIGLGLGIAFTSEGGTAVGEPSLRAVVTGGKAVLDLSGGDGLLSTLAGNTKVESAFELAVSWTPSGGLAFEGAGGLEIDIPLHVTAGPVAVTQLVLAVRLPDDGTLPIEAAADVKGAFGPFALSLSGVGVRALVSFPGGTTGNLGPVNLDVGFKLPTGIGVSIDGGGITGGGFLARDDATGRYSGAIELRVFALGVKAFGVLDTKFPDGTDGMSFVVVIIAEFTPIQLGFGFTLNGVGGLLGVNRTVDADALGMAVRTGSLAHLLFPVNVVQDAPAIINDLATVFPATRDHQLFGPMGKLGWGTPTLITADVGIVIDFPGPRLAVLGVVRMQLPSAEFAILSLNLAILGLLDFPARKFSIDASLFDSYVAGYTVSGDMSFRLELGSKPSFLLAVGGFNPGFHPPAQFPKLRRVSADLGLNGNPSLTASGYFALTSNTAQFGAALELRASGFGIHLRGGLALDVMFVFSPFSFTASISAGVHVDFHGFGLGISLHGNLSGPTPWHFSGRACVEICIWEACLPIDIKFGRQEPAALPEMDPWVGTDGIPDIDPRIAVRGLESSISDPRNWAGETPPEGYSVVSLTAAATAERTPIDPVGSATLRQRVCPLHQELERFGQYRPFGHTHFFVRSVDIGMQSGAPFDFAEDDFAPAQFMNKSNAQKLSGDSYDKMVGGVRLSPDTIRTGSSTTQTVVYETVFIKGNGERVQELPADAHYSPTDIELRAMLKRSSAARTGIRRTGTQKYMLAGRPKLLTLDTPAFVVADACSNEWNTSITPGETTRTQAELLLRKHERDNPADKNRFRVVPAYLAAA